MRHRQTLWLAAAILTPCIVLTLLVVRLLDQERQLETRRAAEAGEQRLIGARQSLLSAIEPYRLGQTPDSKLAFHGVMQGGRVQLAWQLRNSPESLATLEKAVQANDAGLLRRLAALPHDVTDEHGVPIAVYTLPHLSAADQQRHKTRLTAQAAENPHALSAMGLRLVGAPSQAVETAQQAEAFRTEGAGLPASEGRWLGWGHPLYLIGFTPNSTPGRLTFRAIAAPANVSMEGGEPLGPPFANLRVRLPSPPPSSAGRDRTLFIAMFVVTVAGTLLAGLLLFRDARREKALAALRTQFIAGVSHELRTPLTALRIFIESMKMTPDLAPATREHYLDTMLHETERLSRLVDNVLEFSRIERQTKTYNLAPISLPDVLESLLDSTRPMLERTGFTLKANLAAAPPIVRADRDALEQALLNLIANAMKYSGNSREIEVTVRRHENHAAIEVRDFGIGIPAAQQPRIFDSFYRVPSPENRNIQGAGLGLTLVRHVMEGHGGQVTVESDPGKGSAFCLFLPL